MGNLYIAIIILCRIGQSFFNKKSSNALSGSVMYIQYGACRQIFSGVLGLLLVLIAGNGFRFDWITLVTAGISGLALFVNMVCGQTVLKSGTMALSSLFGTAGLLVPCIAGIFLFQEPMSVGQWFGVALLLVSAYFLISASGKIHTKFTWKTLFLLLGLMISNGITMLMQQMFMHYSPDGDVTVFSFFTFSIVGVALLLVSIPLTKRASAVAPQGKDNTAPAQNMGKNLLIYGAVLSTIVFIINQLATLATILVSPAILFAFINGGATIISTLVAAICFHERLTVKSVIGVLLGVTALVIIKAM